ncbi:MAG: recombinase family protein [Pirellulales bacterium]|nr:recombinase family protein [Pirellulales bacterium]
MSRQPKVAIYARVSTDEQSPDAQLRDLREYVRNRGWELISEFIDIGESGSKDVRPAWSELWMQLRQRKFNIMVVSAIDRVGRSLPHLVKTLATIEELNVTLISLREAFDLSTAQGRMLAGLFSVLADYELSLIKERTKAGMRAARAKGKRIGPKKNHLCHHKATELLDKGLGQIKVAKALGVGVGRINQFVHEVYVPEKQRKQLAASVATMEEAGNLG